ncbi:MAG: T9SS type A sorting domain-containing protein [Bacteroidia bacterium]|nr:T9SS type A sorting domain-containing protein [Bacteroidia bacterium]
MQCPLEGGNAVWQARVLYSTIENEWIEFADNCNTAVRQMTVENTPTAETTMDKRFKLYPNPNNGQMVLEYTIEETDNAVLAIYDLTGKKINTYMINGKNKSLLVNEDQLEAGIYSYQITINDKLVKKDKLVIIK